MIETDITNIFVGYTSILLVILILWWIRITITFNKGWKISEDQVIQCRECSYKFVVNALTESEECPNCKAECQVRWDKQKKKQPPKIK